MQNPGLSFVLDGIRIIDRFDDPQFFIDNHCSWCSAFGGISAVLERRKIDSTWMEFAYHPFKY